MSPQGAYRVLVPVGESVTLRNTVGYVVREAVERAAETDERASVHFVFPASWQRQDPTADVTAEAEDLLERVEAWIHEDTETEEGDELPVYVTTAIIGTGEYLFSPRDYAETLLSYARTNSIEHIVLDPEFKPGARAPLLTPLSAELSLADDVTYEEAPVDRAVRGRTLLGRDVDLRTFASVFGLSYLFYLAIGGFAGTFDFVTGAVSAAIVSVVLSGITFDRPVRPMRTGRTLARWLVYTPFLLWEIAKANIEVAIIVLRPSLPIEPSMEKIQPAVPGSLPVTSLANSITLTPGTITVDVRGNDFYIHTLTESAREALYDGDLEQAVRFVFFGRDSASIASPRERGQNAGDLAAEAEAEATAAADDDAEGGEES
ncbi:MULTISPECIES: monovalent cation/H+ antiporter subunit E [Salinibaculum]|uniref:monovalent cation/H+ antiporter subunit E n=1 Tax=Salinibaculum TaxID=2732368 RepID=UPI0030D26019